MPARSSNGQQQYEPTSDVDSIFSSTHDDDGHDEAQNPDGSKPREAASPKAKGKRKTSDGDDKSDAKKLKKARSCSECKRRKIKCDRETPCDNCTKRGYPETCQLGDVAHRIDGRSEVVELRQRLAAVEQYLADLRLPTRTGAQRFIPSTAHTYPSTPSPAPPLLLRGTSARNGSTLFSNSPHVSARSSDRGRDHEETFSDVEDAAVDLENGVFGNGLKAGQPSKAEESTNDHLGGKDEITKEGTSIIAPRPVIDSTIRSQSLAHLGIEFTATPNEIRVAHNRAIGRILQLILSDRDLVLRMVDRYFLPNHRLFSTLHQATFRSELDYFLHDLCDMNRANEVDPLWLSLLCMVLCVALNDDQSGSSSNNTLTPAVLFSAAVLGLSLGSWQVIPRIRSIQTIILITQFLQLSTNESNDPSERLTWLAAAIRLAYSLGLHRLSSNPETMPMEDAAFPRGKNSLKRESAKRIFSILVYQDWMNASKVRCSLIDPAHFDTDAPSNLDDSDLSSIDWRIPVLPLIEGRLVLTSSTTDIIRLKIARNSRRFFDCCVVKKNFDYETVLSLDAGYRSILNLLPKEFLSDTTSTTAVHFVLEGIHNRILRLHRPFLTRGYKNAKYRYSTDACITSARLVIISSHRIVESIKNVWYCYSHIMGAALVLSCDLFAAIDSHAPISELEERSTILRLAASIFDFRSIDSISLKLAVQQGSHILLGLLSASQKRRDSREAALLLTAAAAGDYNVEEEMESFAMVLTRISRLLNSEEERHRGTPPATRHFPSALASSSSMQHPHYHLQQQQQDHQQHDELQQDQHADGFTSMSNSFAHFSAPDDLSLQFYLNLMTDADGDGDGDVDATGEWASPINMGLAQQQRRTEQQPSSLFDQLQERW